MPYVRMNLSSCTLFFSVFVVLAYVCANATLHTYIHTWTASSCLFLFFTALGAARLDWASQVDLFSCFLCIHATRKSAVSYCSYHLQREVHGRTDWSASPCFFSFFSCFSLW
ncbi:unnamed protein product [Ectocarpus sp. 8 AP-2014]